MPSSGLVGVSTQTILRLRRDRGAHGVHVGDPAPRSSPAPSAAATLAKSRNVPPYASSGMTTWSPGWQTVRSRVSSAASPLAKARPAPAALQRGQALLQRVAGRVGGAASTRSPAGASRPRPGRTWTSGRSAAPPRRCAGRAPGPRGSPASRSRRSSAEASACPRSAWQRYGRAVAECLFCAAVGGIVAGRRRCSSRADVVRVPRSPAGLQGSRAGRAAGHTSDVWPTCQPTAVGPYFLASSGSRSRSRPASTRAAPSSRSTTGSASRCRTCTPTSYRGPRATACAASSGPGRSTRPLTKRPTTRRASVAKCDGTGGHASRRPGRGTVRRSGHDAASNGAGDPGGRRRPPGRCSPA